MGVAGAERFHSAEEFSFLDFSKRLVLFRQKNHRGGAVGFSDDVELHSCKCSIAAQEPQSSLQAELVFSAVLLAQVAPFAANVAREKVLRSLSCFFESGQGALVWRRLVRVKTMAVVRFAAW